MLKKYFTDEQRKQAAKERSRRFYRAHKAEHAARVKAWQVRNHERWREICKNSRDRDKTKSRNRTLVREFGITLSDYNSILVSQNGKCALCGAPPRSKGLHVDHDHATGKVRGLLCGRCNMSLERVEIHGWAIAALSYLERHGRQLGRAVE